MNEKGAATQPLSANVASLIVFLSASLWGLYWVPLRYLDEQGIEGGYAVALLNLPAAVVLIPLVWWQWRRHQGYLTQTLIIGALTGLGLALYTSGLIYSSVVRATLLFYVTPVWATLIGIFWLGEKANWPRWAAIACGLIGLGLMVSGGSSGSLPLNVGDLFAFLSGIFWALGASVIRRFDDVPLPGMTMVQFVFAGGGAILLGIVAGQTIDIEVRRIISALPIAVLVSLLIILPTVWLIFWAQKFLFPGRASLLMMSEVLVAVITASIFLPEELMSWVEWFGAVLIIGACLIEVMVSPDRKAP